MNYQRNFPSFILVTVWAFLSAGCGNDGDGTKSSSFTDSPDEGTIHISVDESFKPIIDSQIQVYESQHPKAHIIADYKSEAECLKDIASDSTRMIIVTRGPTENETKYFESKNKFKLRYGMLAYDAISVVINKQARDSLFTMVEIRELLSGTSKLPYKVVLDGLNATSNVRYVLDSILRGAALGKNVQAARNSQGVIDYVSADPNAIGFVGVSWIGVREDAEQLSFTTDTGKTKLASLQCSECVTQPYVLPYLPNILRKRYPMIRGLHYILKENGRGLGSGFYNFLTGQKGQLIFKRAYLLPAKMQFEVRNVSM